MSRKIKCPINQKTKEKYECKDCKLQDDCIEDILNDFQQDCIKGAAKVGKQIAKILKEKRGI